MQQEWFSTGWQVRVGRHRSEAKEVIGNQSSVVGKKWPYAADLDLITAH